ncbi:hypothetical protein BDV93DRAFT_530086, partial [Ceratobasidium sp. AG-I]
MSSSFDFDLRGEILVRACAALHSSVQISLTQEMDISPHLVHRAQPLHERRTSWCPPAFCNWLLRSFHVALPLNAELDWCSSFFQIQL